jgi:hypothetical protein
LRHFLLILTFILSTAILSQAQERRDVVSNANTQRIIKSYPNPAVTFIKFDFQSNYRQGYILQVINFVGRQVYEAKNINASTTLNLASFNRGVYIYQLKDATGKVIESGKFQVAK